MKKYIITFLFSLVVFFILGGVFGTLVFLPEMTSWYKAFPNAVRETPDFVSGFIVGLVQLIGAILLVDNVASGGSIWPTETEGTTMFLKMIAKAQKTAIHGSDSIVDFYPPQGVTISSWTA